MLKKTRQKNKALIPVAQKESPNTSDMTLNKANKPKKKMRRLNNLKIKS